MNGYKLKDILGIAFYSGSFIFTAYKMYWYCVFNFRWFRKMIGYKYLKKASDKKLPDNQVDLLGDNKNYLENVENEFNNKEHLSLKNNSENVSESQFKLEFVIGLFKIIRIRTINHIVRCYKILEEEKERYREKEQILQFKKSGKSHNF